MRPGDIDPKEAFRRLESQKADIEREVGLQLEWQELKDAKGSRIAVYRQDVQLDQDNDWPNQFAWLAERLEGIDRAFRSRIRTL
jgi:hypothetical protein